MPVSYTHLDVYKRQIQHRIGGALDVDAVLPIPFPAHHRHQAPFRIEGNLPVAAVLLFEILPPYTRLCRSCKKGAFRGITQYLSLIHILPYWI